MKAGVVTFPGSNCDDDCLFALEQVASVSAIRLWHKDKASLGEFDCVVLPGGFSYGDYLRTGAIASTSPIMESIKEYAEKGGKILGICNGFQILCEAQLLPGALIKNQTQQFICRDVELEVVEPRLWFSQLKTGTRITLPIAHGEGRYVVEAATLQEMKKNQQILLRYCEDLNGSVEQIAGVTNREGNVCGMMPHPERASDLRSRDGLILWKSVFQKGLSPS